MEHDAWFFIGVFVFIFLIWIATGGPLRPISFAGPSLAQPDVLGGGTYLSFPRAPYTIGTSDVVLPGSSGGGSISDNSDAIPPFVGGTSFGTPSPYRGKVTMNHYINGPGSADPKNEYFELRASANAGVPVNISEWSLVSEATGASTRIPKGTEIPISGTVNASEQIVLSPGDRAIVNSGRSPIGASFRENKCIGYFSTFQTFSPSLPQSCPIPSDELSTYYGPDYIRDAACIDYVRGLPRCQVVLTPPNTVSNACKNFLVSHLNYNGCIDFHRKDANFLGDTWRIYLGRTTSMWRAKHEIVKLLDANGKTVDAFSY